jgi:chlorite dismutase
MAEDPREKPDYETTVGDGLMDVREKGTGPDGTALAIDRRLFMQMLAFGKCVDPTPLIDILRERSIRGVLYLDVNDPFGIALLTMSEDPETFVRETRALVRQEPFAALQPRPQFTLLGRTYALGNESDLVEALIHRPQQRVCDRTLPWAVWYPLRRNGQFETLSREEQRKILMEHGGIGRAYGKAGLAYDIRLACHGLDLQDNDFVIGLLGPQLHPLSVVVQHMRRTRQTSLYIDRLGPFFVGKALWQSEWP